VLARAAAAAAVALALTGAGAYADEAEIMAHYDAYNAAFEQGRFDDADAEAEAAWRGAEAEWGAGEETAVLALNLARLRLMLDRRAPAIEPAARVAELVEAGTAGASIGQPEATLLASFARYEAEDPSRDQVDALETAALAFEPADVTGRRIHWLAWSHLAKAQSDRRQWRRASDAAERALASMDADGAVPNAFYGATTAYGVRAAVMREEWEGALTLAHRGIAKFPPQPASQPIDSMLGVLIGWDQGLHNIISQNERDRSSSAFEHDPEPAWQVDRYPSAMGCAVEWLERPPPDYPPRAAERGQVLAMMFEYYLDADGAVARVDPVGNVQETAGFADAVVASLRRWRATPQPRAECHGPWAQAFLFQMSD
jgi:hypothetical protein